MGYAKEQLQNEQANEEAAAEMIAKHGYLKRCDNHSDVWIDQGQSSDAEEIAKDLEENGEDLSVFGERDDAVRAIKGAIAAPDYCPSCDNNMRD